MGEIADGVNALISLGRGDVAGATLSATSMLPIVGDAIGKGGKIARAAIKHGDEVLEVAGGIVRAGVATTTSLTTIDVVIDSSKAAEVLSQSGISSEAQNNDKLGQILNDAKPGHETKGRTKQWNKTGGIDDANDDFDSLNPQNVKEIPGGRTGKLPDGRKINVRDHSSDGRPTLEIQDGKNKIKIRYGE